MGCRTGPDSPSHSNISGNIPRLCSVGYVQIVPGVFSPGNTLQRTSVSSVGHSHPYPELLEVLYDIHTCTRNFWVFCTPVPTIPGVRVLQVLYPLGTSVSYVRLCHNTRNFWKFCKILLPLPGNFVTSVRLAQYPGYGYTFVTTPGELCKLVYSFRFNPKSVFCIN